MSNQALSTPPSTPPPTTQISTLPQPPFDIIKHYNQLLNTDATSTPSIAAIESLISLLSSSRLQTVSETLSLLNTASTTLLASQRNPLPVSAGTDLFQRYMITSFNHSPLSSQSGSDFTALRNQLISNSKLFVARAKKAKSKIASHALPLLFGPTDDAEHTCTVITYGNSRVVDEVLKVAAEKNRWFNVIHIQPSPRISTTAAAADSIKKISTILSTLRKSHIQTSTIPLSSLALTLATLSTHPITKQSQLTFVLMGTEAVLENGAVVSELGSTLVASMARAHGLPVYIASESFKFVRQFPVGTGEGELRRMGVQQDVLIFDAADVNTGHASAAVVDNNIDKKPSRYVDVEIVAPDLITGLVTETGMMTPNAIAEELIKLWF